MTIRLLHISDLHIHGDAQRDEPVARALSSIAERYRTHHLVVTGDIVDDGEATQLRAAYELLSPFAGRISLCPGNHDVGVLGNFYSPDAAQRYDELLALPLGQGPFAGPASGPTVDVLVDPEDADNRALLIGLDSTLATVDPLDFARGEIGSVQLSELEGLLTSEAALSMTRVVYLHHHPFLDDPFLALGDADRLLDVLAYRADLVLFGHEHRAQRWRDHRGIAELLAADTLRDGQVAWEIAIGARDSLFAVEISTVV